jgi:membrane-associated protein
MENWISYLQNVWLLLQQGQLPEVGHYNYVFLGILVAVEGPIATLLGAAAASAGLMRVWAVFLAAAIGNLTADTLWYLVGYHGKIDSMIRMLHWNWLKQRHVDRLTSAMQIHAVKILFFAKLTAGFMIPALIATGIARIPMKRWFPVLVLGEMIWTGTLVLIGYYTTEAIKDITQGISILVLIGSIIFLVIIILEGRNILSKTIDIKQVTGEDEETPVVKSKVS